MSAAMVHLHSRVSDRMFCDTVCGLPCDSVDTAYRGRDPERVTCPECLGVPMVATPERVADFDAALARATGRDWREMPRELFDTDAPAASLFDASPGMTGAPVDGAGTGDLLSLISDHFGRAEPCLGRAWIPRCVCGWYSRTFVTEAAALAVAEDHAATMNGGVS